MKNGTITLEAVNMLGYTAKTRPFAVRGDTSMRTFKFLKSIERHFEDFGSFGHGIRGDRSAAFINYCDKHGFTVKVDWGL